jgi:hypothetical protein
VVSVPSNSDAKLVSVKSLKGPTMRPPFRTGPNPPRGRTDEVSDDIAVRARDLMDKGVEMDDAIEAAMEEQGCPRTARPAVKQLARRKCHDERDLAFMRSMRAKDLSPQIIQEIHRAYREGWSAASNGERPEDSPYQIGSPHANAGWQAGYQDQQAGREPAVTKAGDDRFLSRDEYDPDDAPMESPANRWDDELSEGDLEVVLEKLNGMKAGMDDAADDVEMIVRRYSR